MAIAAFPNSMTGHTQATASPPRRAARRAGCRIASLIAVGIWSTACGEDLRSELLEVAAASDPAERSLELTACIFDSLHERHGSEVARRLVEMARAHARGEALPSDARAVLAVSLQEAARCAERLRRERSAADVRPREPRIPRGAHS